MVSVICTYCTTSEDTISNKQNLILYRKLMQKKNEWVILFLSTNFFMQHSQHMIPSGKYVKHGPPSPRINPNLRKMIFRYSLSRNFHLTVSPLNIGRFSQKERVGIVFQLSNFQVRAISCRECEYPIYL